MKSTQLLNKAQFRDAGPSADPIYVDKDGRALLFALKSGQSIKGHEVPHSPFYAVILKGHGVFIGKEGTELRAGPNDLLVFEPGEQHEIRAESEDLVFIGFLHGALGNTSSKVGGALGRATG